VRRIGTTVASGILLLGIAGLGYWAGTNAVAPPTLPIDTHPPQTYRAETGTVDRSIRVPITASWATIRTLYAARDGVVTSVPLKPGDQVADGTVIATVDLEPLVAAQGKIPMFRTLKAGVRGPDVAQFQTLLTSLGFYRGAIDGKFSPQTAAACKRWQRSIGAPQDQIVDAGSLVFVDNLPIPMEVLAAVGQRIGAGSELVRVLGTTPDFIATVTAAQRAELSSGSSVSINAPGGSTWPGTLRSFKTLEDGRYSVAIGGTLCGLDCGLVPVDDQTAMSGSIELVPETSGTVVPSSALVQQATGGVAVTLGDGTIRTVRVVAEADGFAVVDGIQPGTVIELPSPPGQ
jgi:peptidoglycan hydrolase-like protein with peptidoglycan-binding domain